MGFKTRGQGIGIKQRLLNSISTFNKRGQDSKFLSTIKYDVIVIGAGYAGLTAARNLKRGGKNILLLEARDRGGGRIYTKWLDENIYVDLGGQWIGVTQNKMYALCKEYQAPTFAT